MLVTLLLTATLVAGTPLQSSPPAPETVIGPAQVRDRGKQPDREFITEPGTESVMSRQSITIKGKAYGYTATAGHLPVMNDGGETEARIFFIAYTADKPPSGMDRPILFIFNGGPGAASIWLHLGAIGPRRVLMLPDGSMPPPPYRLVDNEHSWLDHADLVFIDPVGTGYSRAVKPELAAKFAATQGDIDSMGRFIRLYLSRYERWRSPVFLVGESYGTFRAGGLSEYLVEHGIGLNGIIMVSTVLNFQTISFDNGNDLPYALFLPSYTATAWYHRKLPPRYLTDLDTTLAEVEKWAATDYSAALFKGDRLSPDERQAMVAKLAEYTGLDKTFIDSRNLRINTRSFVKELLRDRNQVTGTMDSRFIAMNPDPAAAHLFDPTVATIRPPFTATFNDYVRKELGVRLELEYFTLGGGVGSWNWETKNSYADTSDNLRNSFAKNPYMKLFVASGCFDLATPHFAADYTLSHLGLPPSLRNNITIRRYPAGHMMYLDSAILGRLKDDVAEFIGLATAPRTTGN